MKIVGLNIEKGRVAASIIVKGLRHTELKESFSRAFATDAELVEILKEKAADWSGSRIVSSIAGSRVSQRLANFPFSDRKRIEKALPFEIEDSVPFPLDDVEIDHLVLDRAEKGHDKKRETAVVAIMVPKTVLRQHLDLLASGNVDPQAVVPSYIGLYHIATMVPVEGVAVLIQGTDLCVKDGAVVRACRSFSRSQASGGIRHTLRALETELGVRIGTACLLSADDAISVELADLGIAVEQVAPDFNGKKAADPLSLGLALSDQANFRKGAFAYRLVDIDMRRRRRTLIIAGAAAVLFAVVNLSVRYYVVQASYGKLDREIKEIFHQAVPEAKVVTDPVKQLRSRLDETRKQFGVLSTGTSVLEVMKAVTEGIPKEVRVSFQEFTFEGDKLKLQGEAASFESVDKMKAELLKSPLFPEVAVLDTRMGVENKVKFRFEIKLKQAQ